MRVLLALLVAAPLAGCGARTSLNDGLAIDDAQVEGDGAADATGDAEGDGATLEDVSVVDVVDPPDVAPPDAVVSEVACSSDAECDDGIPCTRDRCDADLGLCRHQPRDERCRDGVYCNGDERCDLQLGCVEVPRPCADAVSCTRDVCDEAARACVHVPDDTACPISHGCDPALGCQARAIAHSPTDVYEIRLPSAEIRRIGPTSGQLTDIALHPNGKLYGISFSRLCEVDLATGGCTSGVSVGTAWNGLDAAPDGTLYASGGSSLYAVDPVTGASTIVAPFPPGLSSSGDLAFVGPRLFATSTGIGATDVLVEFDVTNKRARLVGSIGFDCVWGLAGFGPTLYGLTCNGVILRIDVATGRGTQLTTSPVQFWGATAR